MTTKILIADDHKILREGLQILLEKERDIEVVGEAREGRTAVSLAKKLRPEVVIMDVVMPDLSGVEATRQIIAESPSIKIIGLSMHADKRFVSRMLQAGASGYVLKDCAVEELARAIQTVLKNRVYLSAAVTGIIVKNYVEQLSAVTPSGVPLLTPRECEVLQLLAEGKTTKETAGLLYVSAKTVETHRKNIMEKLDTHSIAELTKYAIREGITTVDTL